MHSKINGCFLKIKDTLRRDLELFEVAVELVDSFDKPHSELQAFKRERLVRRIADIKQALVD